MKSGNRYATSKRRSGNNWKPYVDMALLRPAQEEMFGVAVQAGKQAEMRLATASNLSAVEMRKLKSQVKVGHAARIDLFGPNIRLALKHAHSWNRGYGDIDDLEIYAAHGLWRATATFDPEKGFRFTTYATPWIKSYLQRGRLSDRLIQLPEDVWIEVNAMLHFQSQYLVRTQREATVEEVAEALHRPVARIYELMKYAHEPISYDQYVGDDDDVAIIELVADDTYVGLDRVEDLVAADQILAHLDDTQRRVIAERAGMQGKRTSRRVVSRELGVSEGNVREIEKTALGRLRGALQPKEGR